MEQVNDLTLKDLGIEGENDPYFFTQDDEYDQEVSSLCNNFPKKYLIFIILFLII